MGREANGAPLHAGASGITRRELLAASLWTVAVSGCTTPARRRRDEFAAQLAQIESRIGGRLGVHVLDTGSQLELSYRADEPYAMCSTFKVLLAAAILSRADAGKLLLDRSIAFGPQDMLSHAPVTSKRLARGSMSVRELCAATVETSDNPAANLLLSLLGGPSGLTDFLRSIGDPVTRLDRTELALNTNLPGDPRDTTTPSAMARTVAKLFVADVLSESSRAQLRAWLVGSRTGLRRLRAGLPSHWEAGDKTGTGANGAANDVMIAWPAGRPAVIVAAYLSESKQPLEILEAAHAQIGRLISTAVAR